MPRLVQFIFVVLIAQISINSYGRNFIPDRSCRNAVRRSDIEACVTVELHHYQTLLEEYRDKVLKLLGGSDKEQFTAAQAAWLKYKKIHCKLVNQHEPEELLEISTKACLIMKIKERETELRSYFHKLGGKEN